MKKIAVIGGGVSGITSAFYLQEKYDVTIFEKSDYLGGHTNSYEVEPGLLVDTGFIVLNDKTYPNFHKFLIDIDVPVRFADMSFGYSSFDEKLVYSGKNLLSLFCDKKNFFNIDFYKFLNEIKNFSNNSLFDLINNKIDTKTSLKEYLSKYNYSDKLIYQYVLPIGASIWSTPNEKMLLFPALTFINFFKNHGLLSLKDRPKWQTVIGGSKKYVEKFKKEFKGKIVLNSKIEKIYNNDSWIVNGEKFDHVILAVHANQVMSLLGSFEHEYENLFNKWTYNKNTVHLHSDLKAMPKNKASWSSWNYLEYENNLLYVSYYMNLLQGITSKTEYIVTLNCPYELDADKIIYKIDYEHPLYTTDSIATQSIISEINGLNNLWFSGSYLGYGFHEDAVSSAIKVVDGLLKL